MEPAAQLNATNEVTVETQERLWKNGMRSQYLSMQIQAMRLDENVVESIEQMEIMQKVRKSVEKKMAALSKMQQMVDSRWSDYSESDFYIMWSVEGLRSRFNNLLSYLNNSIMWSHNYQNRPVKDQVDKVVSEKLRAFRRYLATRILEKEPVPEGSDIHKQLEALANDHGFTGDADILRQVDAMIASFPKFYLTVPWSYCPVEDKCLVDMPCIQLVSPKVKCVVTGGLASEKQMYKTVYGTFIRRKVWDGNVQGCNTEWVEVYSALGKVRQLAKVGDTVPVFGRSNKITLNKVYIPYAKENFFYNPTNDRFYDFDYKTKPYFVMNLGFCDEEELKKSGAKWEEAFGMYILGKFEILTKSSNVLDFFEGFKVAEFEQAVRGSRNASDNTLFMGLELEVEMRRGDSVPITKVNEAAKQATILMNKHAICCSDASLSHGFEIISVPATLAYHYQMWEGLLRSNLRESIGSWKFNSCGIHIHMSKEAFTPIGLGKFNTFINAPHNRDFMVFIAQRNSQKYAAYNETKVSRAKNRTHFYDKDGGAHGKFSATNLTKPHTVEVRIFKGTLNYSSVMKNLEFCHALHSYVHNTAGIGELNYEAFCYWLGNTAGNRKAYPNLINFIKDKYNKILGEKVKYVAVSTPADDANNGVLEAAPKSEPHKKDLEKAKMSPELSKKMRMILASKASSLNYHKVPEPEEIFGQNAIA